MLKRHQKLKAIKVRKPYVPKIVISSDNTNSNALKALANNLGDKVGYKVWRVRPARVGRRIAVPFLGGIDKVQQFAAFTRGNVAAPKHTLRRGDFGNFDYKRVVARVLTNSSEGRGIRVFEKDDPNPPQAPLYTEYIPKKKEFRVHVWNNKVIDVIEKRKKLGHSGDRDDFVRNTANGYVFCRTGVVEPNGIRDLGIAAVRALSRNYGAVDIVWNEKMNKCFVLEVNSRPGMEGTTVEKYAQAILQGINHS